MALYVIGCSEGKADGSKAALLKYAPRQHAALREAFLGAFGSDGFFAAGHDLCILSAEFGVLGAAAPVADYNRKMDTKRAAALQADASQAARFAAQAEGHDEVVVYGGALYRGIIRTWAATLGLDVVELVGGNRGCGDHFSALQAHIAALA